MRAEWERAGGTSGSCRLLGRPQSGGQRPCPSFYCTAHFCSMLLLFATISGHCSHTSSATGKTAELPTLPRHHGCLASVPLQLRVCRAVAEAMIAALRHPCTATGLRPSSSASRLQDRAHRHVGQRLTRRHRPSARLYIPADTFDGCAPAAKAADVLSILFTHVALRNVLRLRLLDGWTTG